MNGLTCERGPGPGKTELQTDIPCFACTECQGQKITSTRCSHAALYLYVKIIFREIHGLGEHCASKN